MYGLNPTAAFVWQTLETVRDLDQMLDAAGAGADAPAFGKRELQAFLDELLDLGLAEEEAPGERQDAALEPPAVAEAPRILWREEVEQIAGTCAFLPAMNPLCVQAPFA